MITSSALALKKIRCLPKLQYGNVQILIVVVSKVDMAMIWLQGTIHLNLKVICVCLGHNIIFIGVIRLSQVFLYQVFSYARLDGYLYMSLCLPLASQLVVPLVSIVKVYPFQTFYPGSYIGLTTALGVAVSVGTCQLFQITLLW